MWTAGLWLFCITFSLSFNGCIGAAQVLEFFEGDNHTFQCGHTIPTGRLTKTYWSVVGDGCGGTDNDSGEVIRFWFCPRLKFGRAAITATNYTIYGIRATEDGQIWCEAETDYVHPMLVYNIFNVTVKVLPLNHSLLLDGKEHACDEAVVVDGNGSVTLTCAVESRPQATFKWSAPGVVGSKTGVTTCDLRADKIYHCESTLSLPKADIPSKGVKVTCQVDAVGNRTDLCVTIKGTLSNTIPPDGSTIPPGGSTIPPGGSTITPGGNTTKGSGSAGGTGSAKRPSLWSLMMLLFLAIGYLAPTFTL